MIHTINDTSDYTKTLDIEWNPQLDHFRITIAKLPFLVSGTKRMLVSDIAKTFDVLGWFSPTVVKVKILLQQLWELKVTGTLPYLNTYMTRGCIGDLNYLSCLTFEYLDVIFLREYRLCCYNFMVSVTHLKTPMVVSST